MLQQISRTEIQCGSRQNQHEGNRHAAHHLRSGCDEVRNRNPEKAEDQSDHDRRQVDRKDVFDGLPETAQPGEGQYSDGPEADAQTPFFFYIDGYVAGQKKHWYKGSQTKLTPRWEKQSMEFSGPSLTEHPQMTKRTAYLIFTIPASEKETGINIHSVELEQLGK